MCNVWQIGGGPKERDYAEEFLKFGVALIGPGNPGEWKVERPDSDFNGSAVRLFAQLPQKDHDFILLRSGRSTILAVGLVASDYRYEPAFDDVHGWDLQHAAGPLVPLAGAETIH